VLDENLQSLEMQRNRVSESLEELVEPREESLEELIPRESVASYAMRTDLGEWAI
jgi:hypothetical protein